jgi:hypothetical protein
MAERRLVAALFEESPRQWGMRGDPHLWRDLASRVGELPLPETEAELAALLELWFERLAGVPLTAKDPVFLEQYAHGGMTSGYVNPPWWLETGLPFLRGRYRTLSHPRDE